MLVRITCLFSYRGFSCIGSNISDADLKLIIGDADTAEIAQLYRELYLSYSM